MNQDILSPIIARAERANSPRPRDYIGADGLRYCGTCHAPRQKRENVNGQVFVHPVQCACAAERQNQEEAATAAQKHALRVEELRRAAFPDKPFFNATFEADDGRDDTLRRLKKYVEVWDQVYSDNTGLLLWGGVGNGKTFAAACIANALIEVHEITVRMTSFSAILNDLTGRLEDRNEYIAQLVQPQLLIIDDLGVERNSPFALEQIYNVVDARYRAQRPLIVTTNLSLAELKSPPDNGLARIYDRILELCAPIQFATPSRRRAAAAEKLKRLATLLGES